MAPPYLPDMTSKSIGGFGTIWKCGQNCRNTIRPPRNAPVHALLHVSQTRTGHRRPEYDLQPSVASRLYHISCLNIEAHAHAGLGCSYRKWCCTRSQSIPTAT